MTAPFRLLMTHVSDNDDDTVTVSIDMDEQSQTAMARLGVEFVLYCAAAGVDLQDALDNIVKPKD